MPPDAAFDAANVLIKLDVAEAVPLSAGPGLFASHFCGVASAVFVSESSSSLAPHISLTSPSWKLPLEKFELFDSGLEQRYSFMEEFVLNAVKSVSVSKLPRSPVGLAIPPDPPPPPIGAGFGTLGSSENSESSESRSFWMRNKCPLPLFVMPELVLGRSRMSLRLSASIFAKIAFRSSFSVADDDDDDESDLSGGKIEKLEKFVGQYSF